MEYKDFLERKKHTLGNFGFDQIMGMGGEKTIMNYSSLALSEVDGVYYFRMNEKRCNNINTSRRM